MKNVCKHCGAPVLNDKIRIGNHLFCCEGCKTVYEILNLSGFQNYYELNKTPGIKPETNDANKFTFLDTPEIRQAFIDFEEGKQVLVNFHVPVIHCSSCVWLLESLSDLQPGVLQSTTNFTTKEVSILYDSENLKLSELVGFMAKLGYKPNLSLDNLSKETKKLNRSLIYKLVVAGFCFGNVMLISFPEYVDSGEYWLEKNKVFFRWLAFALSLPVVFYSATDYYKTAWQGIRNRFTNLDIPIALGILSLFLRSVYEIVFDLSGGYFDSLCGLVFFMLVGKWFQKRTYQSMQFDRDYTSFYPLSVTKLSDGKEENIILNSVKVGDRLLIRNQELIPADSIIIKGDSTIDYSFINGEAKTVQKLAGDRVFAGGKVSGKSIEIDIVKDLNQSYLNKLWSNKIFTKKESHWDTLTNTISKYFVWVVLGISFGAGIYWFNKDASAAFEVFTAVLIVACPCALALSAPFIFGNMMRIFGRNKFYVKDAMSMERLAEVDHIIFDKTGTLTENQTDSLSYIGKEFDHSNFAALARESNHPLSQSIYNHLKNGSLNSVKIEDLKEVKGKGLEATIDSDKYFLGSANWVGIHEKEALETRVYLKKNEEQLGYFKIQSAYRSGISKLNEELKEYDISILSGDQDSEKEYLSQQFPNLSALKFRQQPEDKLDYVQDLESKGKNTMMVGDGLNDAGALKASSLGVAVVNETGSFSPASDAILDGNKVEKIPEFLALSKKAKVLVYMAFTLSLMYNTIGLGFAITGNLSPIVAAILMPISSISIVLFATFSTHWIGRKL